MKINCDNCGIEFNKRPSDIVAKNYCSKECRHEDKHTICKCDTCGKEFKKLKSSLREYNFCNLACARIFNSKRMTAMNIELNPMRMTISTRLKLRQSRLNKNSKPKGYIKYLGKHLHRIIASIKINRPLKKGEI